ncbi:DUF771 domain-containing protein [Sporosarcina highlanderae]|uniref:DUF771 domain-containing protein n=1 Tax=Sporosarcina highlanderae TaxID=3035916 RepID=A0ABT8JPW0_9BACL|nr:DUF771 domain-containing protein [Sporosarcina highlanderae]MDN4607179.1 DUF771 domain-containing protein [Sporosarcina highlanderae]
MNQKLNVELIITIPESQVIIEKLEFEALKKADLLGVYWSMVDLEKRIGRKKDWIKQNILYNPRFKSKLDCSTGGFVFYPKKKGEPWSMHALLMANFLDENFNDIFRS